MQRVKNNDFSESGILGLARTKTFLTDQSCLLVTKTARDWNIFRSAERYDAVDFR
jgi:hypothetical protein